MILAGAMDLPPVKRLNPHFTHEPEPIILAKRQGENALHGVGFAEHLDADV
jgi:hypothetical protein